jgi:hypothetical protein
MTYQDPPRTEMCFNAGMRKGNQPVKWEGGVKHSPPPPDDMAILATKVKDALNNMASLMAMFLQVQAEDQAGQRSTGRQAVPPLEKAALDPLAGNVRLGAQSLFSERGLRH